MRQKLVVANWKMNTSCAQGRRLVGALAAAANVVICPPFVWLHPLRAAVGAKGFALGAQNCSADEPGPHTGEIAAEMLAEIGCEWVIVGHSERRRQNEDDASTLRRKLRLAAASGIKTILCVGEKSGEDAEAIILSQLRGACDGITPDAVAYEPIWAIGSGRTPSNDEIALRHDTIRRFLGDEAPLILYGGSVSERNIGELTSIRQCQGFLVGGASLDAEKFGKIVAVSAKIG